MNFSAIIPRMDEVEAPRNESWWTLSNAPMMPTPRALAALSIVVSIFVLSPRVALAEACRPDVSAEDRALAPDAALVRAKAYADVGHLEDAASLFRVIALAHPDTDAGRAAVLPTLDALARAASGDPAKPECLVRLTEDVDAFDRLHCAPAGDPHTPPPAGAELCRRILSVGRDVARFEGQRIVESGESEEAERVRLLADGARYEESWMRFGRRLCAYGGDACAGSDEDLFNAAVAYHAAHDYAGARRVRAILLDSKNGFANGALATRAILQEATEWQALVEYAKAADGYELFAKRDPKNDRAADALGDAVILRVALGQLDAARADADAIEAMTGKEEQATRMILGIFVYLAANDAPAADAYAVKKATFFRAHADGMLVAQFDGARASVLLALGKTQEAEKLYVALAKIGSDEIEKWAKAIDGSGPDGLRKLGRALTAIGEARLYLGARAAEKVIAMPVAKGDLAALKAKRAAADGAEAELAKVLDVQPVPAPSTVVAAGVKVARMRAQLWGAAYVALGDGVAEQDEARANAANRACASTAAKWQFVVPGVDRCAAWLGAHDPLYPLVPGLGPTLLSPDELLPSQPWFVDRQNDAVSKP